MLRKRSSYYKTFSNGNDNSKELKHTLVEDITITPKTINVLKSINHFTNLWNLSLKNCRFYNDQTACELLKPLNAFAYLGTLDLSYTDITFEWLQRYIRPLSIQHLKLYGIPDFIFDDPPCRGFLIFCLPLVWMINDQFITFSERRFWHRYYSPSATALSVTSDTHHFGNTSSINDNININPNNNITTNSTVGAGQYSSYIRKHYINPESYYIPSNEQEGFDTFKDIESIKRKEYEYFYSNNQYYKNDGKITNI
ncbi:hypothetical protein BCR36DRAFT_303504 [Piromyces finnis]|uniref:Uncharacterized protein n=1 Tax=Piromyces finnis TaxID=1754191 RepID=A0A1Y1UZU3_9FUNG|nr:hypothetical protein BCR36DRAFT_303504 [Piromyces finnis]|eukprot:ORX43620.1 hypothetical protein BCR36DRAFT_303504 [Piromyces finnis]